MDKSKKPVRAARRSISRLVFNFITANKMADKAPKVGLVAVVKLVKAAYPKSKFSSAHWDWYHSRYNRQKAAGLGVDCLHELPEAKPAAKAAKSQPKAKAAKKAAKKSAGVEKE